MKLIEIRFHGRGGQGAQVACLVLAKAAFMEGKEVQSFPYFGVERRGAPVTAFTKIDDRPIRIKSQIYEPDHVIILDQKLVRSVDVTSGLKEGGVVLINTEKPAEAFADLNVNVKTVNATQIAIDHGLGSKEAPIVNTAILGAFASATGLVKIESVVTAIKELPRKPDANAKAAQAAYDAMEGGA